MSLDFGHILSVTFALFAVIDILGSIPILLTLRDKMGDINAMLATVVSGVLMLLFFFFGNTLLGIMGIDVNSFAIAGSIVIFILALEMILGIEFFKGDNNPKSGSVVPIAFPMIAGSGTLTTVMSMKTQYNAYNILIAIFINLIIIYLVIRSLDWLERMLGHSGILVIRKFFGVILIAIAVKMFRSNIGF